MRVTDPRSYGKWSPVRGTTLGMFHDDDVVEVTPPGGYEFPSRPDLSLSVVSEFPPPSFGSGQSGEIRSVTLTVHVCHSDPVLGRRGRLEGRSLRAPSWPFGGGKGFLHCCRRPRSCVRGLVTPPIRFVPKHFGTLGNYEYCASWLCRPVPPFVVCKHPSGP